jgi:hypothetical protein
MGRHDGVIVTNLVMTFPKLSAANEHAVNSGTKGLHNKQGIHPAGAHDPDDPYIGWILKTGDTR